MLKYSIRENKPHHSIHHFYLAEHYLVIYWLYITKSMYGKSESDFGSFLRNALIFDQCDMGESGKGGMGWVMETTKKKQKTQMSEFRL